MNRKWLPAFADLIDRMTIHQLKEVFIPENIQLTGELIRSIIVLAQMNEHIWYNESEARKGRAQDLEKLKLTHGINGVRNRAMNLIKVLTGEGNRLDLKTDCLADEFKDWEISLLDQKRD